MNALTNSHVEQRHPILHRLQREADKNQAYSEDPHALLRRMTGKVLRMRGWMVGAVGFEPTTSTV